MSETFLYKGFGRLRQCIGDGVIVAGNTNIRFFQGTGFKRRPTNEECISVRIQYRHCKSNIHINQKQIMP